MKLRSSLLLWALFFCLPLQVFAQKITLSKAELVKTYAFYKNTDPSLSHLNYFDAKAGEMRLSEHSKMVLTEVLTDGTGITHFKYQQYHEGLPIFGSRYILHEKDGRVLTATGNYSPRAEGSARPGINAATAVAFAKQAMKARGYGAKAVEPVLCFVDPAFPKVSETLRLAYQLDLHSTEPYDKRRYFVDAANGKVIAQFPLILKEGVPSTAKTRYYGVQNIITDSLAPGQFVLRDLTRGEGILIYNSDGGGPFTNTSSHWDLTNDQKDEVALDAHFCTQEYYDMMLDDFGWQGLDGNGKALQVYVHAGDFANAFWNGEASSYGDGDCNYGPLTTLEVVGHEFTHGLIDYTSRLVYEGESGAINESLADMFGKMLERKTDPDNFSWVLSHSFILSPNVEPFRVMNDPNSLGMPAYYKGLYWEDFNGVHTNSSIGNLWFTMLVDGKQGVNEVGTAFNVPALGMDKVGQIVFQTNRYYLTENSNYTAFYQYTTAVAEALFGIGSVEAQAVTEAWKAVGLPGVPSQAFDLGITRVGDFYETYCGINQFIPVKFNITNTSSIAYDPSAGMASVTLFSSFLPDHTVHLSSPIGPGEVFEILVDDWLWVTEFNFVTVNATLDITDENFDNNFAYSYFDIKEFAHDDLSLFVSFEEQKCFASEQHIGLYISNQSCEPVAAGAVVSFTAKDGLGNLFWASPPFALTEELAAGGSVFTEYEIPASSTPLTFALVYGNDPNLLNNEYLDGSQQAFLPITGNYLNTFEDNSGLDGYVRLNSLSDLTMPYQSSQFFASSSYYEDPELFNRCAEVTSVFDYEYAEGIYGSIRSCLDFSFSPAPVLEFDLVQFRNSYANASNDLYSSMLQAKWEGSGNGEEIIFGQAEGQVVHHSIPLPPFFKGALNFQLYTELGHWGLNPANFATDDFVLLDNLKLTAPSSGTQDLSGGASILVSPNPAQETATIQTSENIKTLLLQNVSGQTLQAFQVNANRHEIDLKGLANGFYLLNVQLGNGAWAVRKLVKMD